MAGSNSYYLNVMTPARTAGVITVTVQSFGASADATVTSTVSVLAGDSELVVARKLYDQILADLTTASALYTGDPVFSDSLPAATWRPTRSDHVVGLWSEANFSVTVGASTTGALVYPYPTPIWSTLDYANQYGPVYKEYFRKPNGDCLEDDDKVALLAATCSQIIALTNNPLVLSTYKHQETCVGTDSIFLGRLPVYDWDKPSIRRPYAANIITATVLQTVKNSYSMNHSLGQLSYRFAQDLVWNIEPFEDANELIMTYVSGYFNIPTHARNTMLRYTSLAELDPAIRQLKHGTFSVTLQDLGAVQEQLRKDMDGYTMPSLP